MPSTAYAKPRGGFGDFDMTEDWPALAAMVCGVIGVGMMFPDWWVAEIFDAEETRNGFNRDILPAAPIILVILLAAVVAIAGYVLLTRRRRLLPLAGVPAFAALMIIVVMMTTLDRAGEPIDDLPNGSFDLAVGAYLCLFFTLLALCASLYPLLAMLRRGDGTPAAAAPGSARAGGEWTATAPGTPAATSQRPPAPPRPPEFPHAEGD